jgi:hypothetical protein
MEEGKSFMVVEYEIWIALTAIGDRCCYGALIDGQAPAPCWISFTIYKGRPVEDKTVKGRRNLQGYQQKTGNVKVSDKWKTGGSQGRSSTGSSKWAYCVGCITLPWFTIICMDGAPAALSRWTV